MQQVISIKDLGQIISSSLSKNKYTVLAEARQPKISNGHMYLNLKDKDGIVSSIIWKNNITENIKNIKDGDLIEVNGKLEYYMPRGTVSLVISNMKQSNVIGDNYKQFEDLKILLQEQGYFNKKYNLILPNIIKKILIISSKTGAAIQDFYYVLDNNNCNVLRELIDVAVQGIECSTSIINVLQNINQNYDLIIITRGGGSMEDLWGFNDVNLIKAIYDCKIPILSAVGHATDTTICDMVADLSTPTPSLAAQYIVDYNMNYIKNINHKMDIYKTSLISKINIFVNRMESIQNKIKYEYINSLDRKLDSYHSYIMNNINHKLSYYNNIQNKLENMMQMNLVIVNNNKIVNQKEFIDIINNKMGFIIQWNNIKINVINYN